MSESAMMLFSPAWRFRKQKIYMVRLNIAENELSALTVQCVKGRRFGTMEELREEVTAWAADCHARQKGVDWQLTTQDARIKLESLYPKFLC